MLHQNYPISFGVFHNNLLAFITFIRISLKRKHAKNFLIVCIFKLNFQITNEYIRKRMHTYLFLIIVSTLFLQNLLPYLQKKNNADIHVQYFSIWE